VRKGELETVERNRDKSLGVTVYLGHRRGNASTSDFSPPPSSSTVQAAYDIARFTAEDPVAGLPDAADIAQAAEQRRPGPVPPLGRSPAKRPPSLALECEAAALPPTGASPTAKARACRRSKAISSAPTRAVFAAATPARATAFRWRPLPARATDMQRDAWYSSMRSASELASARGRGPLRRRARPEPPEARKIATTQCPVLFESPLAAGLLGGFVQAVSGGALYRKSSFLLDSLGKPVFPKHIDITEDPFTCCAARAARRLTKRACACKAAQGGGRRARGGLLPEHLLGPQAGHEDHRQRRRLAQPGAASRLTRPGDDLDAMLQKLGTGLFVIELMGQGVNYVTGDYSRGASGFWVENGRIAYPVQEITIAGNLKDMLKGIEAVGADAYNYGAKTVGSVLVNRMKVAGS
jgi:PmbA protein